MSIKGGRQNTVEPIIDPGNIAPYEISTNQAATPVPYIAGEMKAAALWVGPAYDQFTRDAPQSGKKGGDKGKGGGGSNLKNYYGSIAGAVCMGPVDELVMLLIDEALAWPQQNFWANGVDLIPVVEYARSAGVATVLLEQVPEMYGNNNIEIINMPDPTFNANNVAMSSVWGAFVSYPSAGPDVPPTPSSAGNVTRLIDYPLGEIVYRAGELYDCILAHTSHSNTGPANATYWARWSIKRVGSPNPFGFTVPNFGQAWFYWGTPTQTLVGDGVLIKYGHPPYRNQAVIELVGFLFGLERTTAPNIEVVIRRSPQQAIIVDSAGGLDPDGQANPAAVCLDVMTNPIYGAGLGAGLFDATTWGALADLLLASASTAYLSPKLDRAIAVRSFLTDLLAYFDGWIRWNKQGLIEAGMFIHNAAPPAFDDTTTINFHDLIEEIKWDTQGWASTANETLVQFANRQRYWKDDTSLDRNGWNLQVVGEPRRNTLERPYITRQQQAAAYAVEYAKIFAQQRLTGNLVARAEKTAAIDVGTLFLLVHDGLGFEIVCRCTEKVIPAAPSGRANLTFEMERGISPLPYHPTPINAGGAPYPPPEAIQVYHMLQPPPSLSGNNEFEVLLLASRVVATTRGLRLWLKQADGALFYDLGEQTRWAPNGTLAQAYPSNLPGPTVNPPDDNSETLQINLQQYTLQGDVQSISDTQTEDSINDCALLAFVYQAAAPQNLEIMAVRSIRLDAGVYKLKVRRGRFGLAPLAFAAGDIIYIIHRADLVFYTHESFSQYAAAGTAATFGLQSFTTSTEGDTADPNQFTTFAYLFANSWAPRGTWSQLQKRAAGDADFTDIADFTVTFDPSTQFRFAFDMSDAGSDLSSGLLVARLGATEQALWSKLFSATAQASQSTIFTLGIGTWSIVLILSDLAGNVVEIPLTPIGGGGDVVLNVAPAAGGQCATPVASPPGNTNFAPGVVNVSLSTTTAGAGIYYSLVSWASPANPPGAWTAYTGPIPIAVNRFAWYTLWTKATKAGMTDSPLGRDNYISNPSTF